jgi:aconitate hydratase 2/2-methylisocitrate dehydratase
VAFVGDVVGTGSSRKSATNSVLWYFGEDTPGIPNKRAGGVCIGGKVAPIFYNTMEDAGALVFEAPVDSLGMGDVIEIRPYDGKILSESGDVLSEFAYAPTCYWMKSVQAGASISLSGVASPPRRERRWAWVRPICFAPQSPRSTPTKASRWHRKWWVARAA